MLGVRTGLGRAMRKRMGNRGLLSPKRGNKGFYKGTGGRKLGVHTHRGSYFLLESKRLEIMAPDMSDCALLPYVAYTTPKVEPQVEE